MNAIVQLRRFPQNILFGALVVLALGITLLGPGVVRAADNPSVESAQTHATTVESNPGSSATPLFAAWYVQVLGDRTRMIQVATLFMIAGIVLLMWTRGK